MRCILLITGLLIWLCLPSMAQPDPPPIPAGEVLKAPQTDAKFYDLIGASDAVVVATLLDVQQPPVPTVRPDGGYVNPPVMTARLTCRIDKVLKGELPATTLQADVPLRNDVDSTNGITRLRGWFPHLTVGQHAVLGLLNTPTGWKVRRPYQDLLPDSVADAVAVTAARYPIQVTLALPAGPGLLADQAVWQVTVKNTGTAPVTLTWGSISGALDLPDADVPVTVTLVKDDLLVGAAPNEQFRVVAPNASLTLQWVVKQAGPANWTFFDPRRFPLSAQVSAMVRCALPGPQGVRWGVKSPLVPLKIALPKGKR